MAVLKQARPAPINLVGVIKGLVQRSMMVAGISMVTQLDDENDLIKLP